VYWWYEWFWLLFTRGYPGTMAIKQSCCFFIISLLLLGFSRTNYTNVACFVSVITTHCSHTLFMFVVTIRYSLHTGGGDTKCLGDLAVELYLVFTLTPWCSTNFLCYVILRYVMLCIGQCLLCFFRLWKLKVVMLKRSERF